MSTQTADPATTTTAGPRTPRGSVAGVVVLLVLLVLAVMLSIAVGSRSIDPTIVLRVLFEPDGSEESVVVHALRLPRTLLAACVGVALGVAGALMQGHTRNPLADPGLLGVSAGAALAVVVAISFLGVSSVAGYAWFALLGAGLATAVVMAIGSAGRGGVGPVTLVLAGAAVSAFLTSITTGIVLRDATTLDSYRFWAVGSVSSRDLDVLLQVLPFLVVGLLLAAMCTPGLNLLQLGDDLAAALGLHPLRHKVLGLGAIMLLTGAATAACGPIGFVGLVVPHIARLLVGVDHRWLVPTSGLVGALLLLVADVIGRLVVRPGELQVGIVLALVGGPAFIALVRRHRLVQL